MNIIKQGYEEISLDSPTKHIERIARVCYKSEDKISDGTDIKMVSKLRENGHLAMLEHYRFIMQVNEKIYSTIMSLDIPYFKFTNDNNRYLISFNVRALIEMVDNIYGYPNKNIAHGIQTELMGHICKQYNGADCLFGLEENPVLSTPVEFIGNSRSNMSAIEWIHHGWMSVLFTTDRGITHELVRHRPCSFAQESTRYCNYSGEINIIEPLAGINKQDDWVHLMENIEHIYKSLIDCGHSPQEARCVLPQCVKSDVVVTANVEEWLHIFELRVMGMKGTPHPQMQELLGPLFTDKIGEWYIKHANNNVSLTIGGDWLYE